jgi:hypothetical protein
MCARESPSLPLSNFRGIPTFSSIRGKRRMLCNAWRARSGGGNDAEGLADVQRQEVLECKKSFPKAA